MNSDLTKRGFSRVWKGAMLGALLVFLPLSSVAAYNSAGNIVEMFNTSFNTEQSFDWHIANIGYVDGVHTNTGEVCNASSCVTQINNLSNHFVRLQNNPTVADKYVNSELSELRTGYPQESQGKWTPSVGQPVTFSVVARWSGNHMVDGTGGAVGSSGFWLWNSPIDYSNPNSAYQQTGIGFNWSDANMLGGMLAGLKATVVIDSYPYAFFYPTQAVDMTAWNTYKTVWSVDEAGVQTVTFFINDVQIGATQLPYAISNLSIETWSDNYNAQFDEYYNVVLGFQNIPSTKYMDLDYISLTK